MYTVADLNRVHLSIRHAEAWVQRHQARLASRMSTGHDTALAELFLEQAEAFVGALRHHLVEIEMEIRQAAAADRKRMIH